MAEEDNDRKLVKSNHVTARIFDLGPAGRLVEICASESDVERDVPGEHQQQAQRPVPVIVLDRSGSMGQWAQRLVTRVLPDALAMRGYGEGDRCVLITFDSVSERVAVAPGGVLGKLGLRAAADPTVGGLRAMAQIKARGGTTMAPAVTLLASLLAHEPEQAFALMVVSDGAVGDKDATVQQAREAVARVEGRSAPVSVALIRCLTSSYADPDTRALACVGALSSAEAPVLDCEVWQGAEKIPELTQVVFESLEGVQPTSHVVLETSDGSAAMHPRIPTAKGVESTRVPCDGGRTFVRLDAQFSGHLVCDGERLSMDVVEGVSEDALSDFLGVVERTLRMWLVAGTRDEDVKGAVEWFRALEAFLHSLAAAAGDVEVRDADSLSVLRRARALKKLVQARTKSVIGRILELGNLDLVSAFNSQQQAEFLRSGVNAGAAGRSLAKRAAKTDSVSVQETLGRLTSSKVTQALRMAAAREEAQECAPVSYYSQSTASECISAALELVPVLSELATSDVLVSTGGMGVPFEAWVSDYPDPYALRIRHVHAGLTLAECDMFLALQQAGGGETSISCPGRPDAKITGVIPLISVMGEELFQLYTRTLRPLAEEQAAAQMRHLVGARIPFDMLALSCSGAWSLLCKEDELLSVERDTLEALVQNVRYMIGSMYKEEQFKDLLELLAEEDCRIHLCGANSISGILKPLAALLKYGATPNLPHVMRALFYLEAYMRARRHYKKEGNERQADLEALLGINYEAHGTPLSPLFEEEPEEVVHFGDVVVIGERLPRWVPRCGPFERTGRMLEEEFELSEDTELLSSVAAVQALLAHNEATRLELEVPDPPTHEFLQQRARLLYAADYQKRLTAKRAREETLRVEREIEAMLFAKSAPEFLGLLQASRITNRSHVKFNALLQRVKAASGIPDRLRKLALLLTGRDMEGNPVWAKGNVVTGDWGVGELYAEEPELYERMLEIKAEYGVYRYREEPAFNRHGHGNEVPSYFAFGFQSLDEFMNASDGDITTEYVLIHGERGCCGLSQ